MIERLEKLMARLYVGWARRHARAFRVVNESEMPSLLRSWGVPEEQIVVLPSQYLDFEVFHPPAEAKEPERDVVFVGRMAANKGVDRILEALARCAAKGRPYRATFVGKGPEREQWIARAARLGLADTTEWIEWIAEPSELADILPHEPCLRVRFHVRGRAAIHRRGHGVRRARGLDARRGDDGPAGRR